MPLKPHCPFKIFCTVPRQPWNGKYLVVKLPGKFPVHIKINPWVEFCAADCTTRYDRYEVSWPSFGGEAPRSTRLFGRALIEAANEAALMTLEYKGRLRGVPSARRSKRRKIKHKQKG